MGSYSQQGSNEQYPGSLNKMHIALIADGFHELENSIHKDDHEEVIGDLQVIG